MREIRIRSGRSLMNGLTMRCKLRHKNFESLKIKNTIFLGQKNIHRKGAIEKTKRGTERVVMMVDTIETGTIKNQMIAIAVINIPGLIRDGHMTLILQHLRLDIIRDVMKVREF